MGRVDRFLKLEKIRPRRAGAGAVLGAGERFADAGPQADEGSAEPAASGTETGRFSTAEPPPKAIAVLADDGGQPFIRCRNCRTDNHLTATKCSFCEASLTTPPQRAYNEALWQRHAAEKAELQAHVQALAASQREANEEALAALRRSRVFELQTTAEERENEPTLGVRLARRIRDPRLRLAVLIVIGVVPLYLVFFGHGDARAVGYLMSLLVGFLFAPRNLRRWLRGGTWNPPAR
jgi:membrane-bound ClpP family serine protease